jgi:hypothetical protein
MQGERCDMGDTQTDINKLIDGLFSWRKRAIEAHRLLAIISSLTDDALNECDKDSKAAEIIRSIQDLASGKQGDK